MKAMNESVFMSALRAFFVALFGGLGVVVALVLVGLLIVGLATVREEETLPSKVKILADAQGSRTKLSLSSPILLQISLNGSIGKEGLTAEKVEEMLLASREEGFKEERVKGILLMINSPGGGVNDSAIIYHLLKAYKERFHIPIYAFVNGLCASGGYYIACAADKIFASDISLVGSIGVVTWPPFMNLTNALEKIGVSTLTLTAGTGKDQMNPFRPWKPEESAHYQTLIDFYYNQFVTIVSENRRLPYEEIVAKLGAEVLPAPKAQEFGLIDQANTTRGDALTALASAAGIEGKYQVVGFESKSWWKKMLKEEPSSPLITGRIKHEISLPSHEENPFSYLFTH